MHAQASTVSRRTRSLYSCSIVCLIIKQGPAPGGLHYLPQFLVHQYKNAHTARDKPDSACEKARGYTLPTTPSVAHDKADRMYCTAVIDRREDTSLGVLRLL